MALPASSNFDPQIPVAASSDSDPQVFAFQDIGWDIKQITDEKVQEAFVKYFTAFVLDEERRTNAVATGPLEVLSKGHWYDNTYAQALKQREQTDRYEWLRKKGSLYHGFAPEGFHLVPCPKDPNLFRTGFRLANYVLNKGVAPSTGLETLLPLKNDRFYFIDCQEAVEIAWYSTIREIFGRTAFNTHFNADGDKPLSLDPNISMTALLPFIKAEITEQPRVGDNWHFANIPLYRVKHTVSNGGGWHVVCVDATPSAPQFIGFGLPSPKDKSQKGVAEKDIYEIFARGFNEKPSQLKDQVSDEVFKQSATLPLPPPGLAHMSLAQLESMQISAEQIADAARTNPELVGSCPEKRRLSATKIKAHLLTMSLSTSQ